jgi:hypothetical protein
MRLQNVAAAERASVERVPQSFAVFGAGLAGPFMGAMTKGLEAGDAEAVFVTRQSTHS